MYKDYGGLHCSFLSGLPASIGFLDQPRSGKMGRENVLNIDITAFLKTHVMLPGCVIDRHAVLFAVHKVKL